MNQDIRDILARQQVERVLPPLGFWRKVALWAPWIVVAWVLILLVMGGVSFWLDALAAWLA